MTRTLGTGTSHAMGESFHTAVLLDAVCLALAPALASHDQAPRGTLVDATCGGGGHSLALLTRFRPRRAILFDRDRAALAAARERLEPVDCPVDFVHAPFSELAAILQQLEVPTISALLADIGVSSHQLDTPARGFSFRDDGPLDMRMDQTRGLPLSELLISLDQDELTRVLRRFGDEPDAARIAAAILQRRPSTTATLAAVVTEAMSAVQRRKLGTRIHPATRTFQALRILVNQELTELESLLETGPEQLEVGGRIAIITFHSLEDRRVKHRFRELTMHEQPPSRVPIPAHELPAARFAIPPEFRAGAIASARELDVNLRARSARMRVLERIAP